MSKRFEIFTDMKTKKENIVDMTKGEMLTLTEACSLLNNNEELLTEAIYKKDSWKRTAGEEASKSCKNETIIEVFKLKLEQLTLESEKEYKQKSEDYVRGELDAYKKILNILTETEKNLDSIGDYNTLESDATIKHLNMELAEAYQRINRIKKLVYVKYGDEYIEQI